MVHTVQTGAFCASAAMTAALQKGLHLLNVMQLGLQQLLR